MRIAFLRLTKDLHDLAPLQWGLNYRSTRQRNKESTYTMNSKNNLKTLILIVSILVALGTFFFFKKYSSDQNDASSLPLVCISQIIEHESLDEERRALIRALAEDGYVDGKTIKIIYSNAQGNLATAAQIAQMQASKNPAVMVAISTPSAQAALSVAARQKIPLVFTAVTDPAQARLTQSEAKDRQHLIAGVSDWLPVKAQIDLMRTFLPDLKTVGVIYNSGEINSVGIVNKLKTALAALNITVIQASAGKTSEIVGATQSLIGRVDAIYVPNDNTAVSAMNSIVQIADKVKLPVFTGDTGSVQKGAFATCGYDRAMLGQKAGSLVLRILRGEMMSHTILGKHPFQIYINEKTRDLLGFKIPESIARNVVIVRQTAIKTEHDQQKNK